MKKNLLLAFLAAVFIITAFFYFRNPTSIAAQSLFLVSPLIAVIGGVCAVRAYGIKNPHGNALAYLTFGIAVWLVGEIIWVVFNILHITPYPSIADVFYLLGYPFLLFGIWKEINLGRIEWDSAKKVMFGFIVLVLICVLIYLGVYSTYDAGALVTQNIAGISYNIGDFLLVVSSLLVLMLALEYAGGSIYLSWICIFIGAVLFFIADIIYGIFPAEFEAGVWIFRQLDLIWGMAYLFFAYGLFNICFIIQGAKASVLEKLKAKSVKKK